jgi:hypothetical protein
MANLIADLENGLAEAKVAANKPEVQSALSILDALPIGLTRQNLGASLTDLAAAVDGIPPLPTLNSLLTSSGLDPALVNDVAAILRTSANLVNAADQLAQLAGIDPNVPVDALKEYVAAVGALSDVVDLLDDFAGAKAAIVEGIGDVAKAVSGP